MEIILTLLSLVAFILLSIFFTSACKVPNSSAPLLTVSFTMLYFVLFGMVGFLRFGGYLYFTLAFLVLILLLIKKIAMPKLSVYFLAFCAVAALMIIFFGIRQPLLNAWDEFSFWGTAVKMTKLNHELHTTAEIGWAWIASQKAGLIVLGYFFQFFGAYAQWKIFIGLNVLALAVFCALCTPFEGEKKRYTIPMLGVLFLVPYVFTINRALLEPSNVYMNAHSDVPMGWLFCGALGMYFVLKHQGAKLWPVAVVLAALNNTRDTALPFAMVVWGIITVDMLFANKNVSFLRFKGIVAKLMHSAVMLASVLVTFFGWSSYLSVATGANPLGDIGGTGQIGAVQMLLLGTAQLLGIDPSAKFTSVMSLMAQNFTSLSLTMVGTGLFITLLIMAMFIVAIIFANNKQERISTALFAVFSALGFFAYYIFIGFTFVFIFEDNVSTTLVGYERYIYPYYIGWFALALYMLVKSAVTTKTKFAFVPHGFCFAILLLFSFRMYQYVPNGMMFLNYHDGYLHEREKLVATAEEVVELIGTQQKGDIYIISQGDDGNRWFQYAGDLLPLQVDYSFGGGTLALPNTDESQYVYELTVAQWCAYLEANNCDYIFVERSNALFIEQFGELFSDNLAQSANGLSVVYKINGTAENMSFELIGEVSP